MKQNLFTLRNLWLLVAALGITLMLLQVWRRSGIWWAQDWGGLLLTFMVGWAALLAMMVVGVVMLGALSALLPIQKKPYLHKFKRTTPLFLAIALLIGIVYTSYFFYRDFVDGAYVEYAQKYEEIQVPADLDCSSVRNGTFLLSDYMIERQGSRQIETQVSTGEKTEWQVEWIDECEYLLTTQTDSKSVKIDAVTSEGYGCFVISNLSRNDPLQHWFLKIKH